MTRHNRALVWFRRDLRVDDNAALSRALEEAKAVYCAFVFDTEILDALPAKSDRRVEFIWESVQELKADTAVLKVAYKGNARELANSLMLLLR